MGHRDGHMDQVPNPYAPPQTAVPFSQYLINYFSTENVLIQTTIPSCPSLGFFIHRLTVLETYPLSNQHYHLE